VSRILIVEDELVIRSELKRLLVKQKHEVAEAGTVREAAEQLHAGFDLVLTDLRLPGALGTEVIALAAPVPVVVMTSYATVRSAVEAIQKGAADYVAKPFDPDELLLTIDRVLSQGLLARQNRALRSDLARTWAVAGIVGTCPAMQAVFDRVRKVAKTTATVLVLGESGTGKELIARAIHEASPRASAPFVAVNCAAIAEGLIEAELFGHEKGAFTGAVAAQQGVIAEAHGGTLFLDEVGELSLAAQARLLRVLQEGEVRRVGASRAQRVDVRLVAATHRDLPSMVAEAKFREDLWFRLRVVDLELPPLRERGDDVFVLAAHMLEKIARKLGRPALSLSAEALAAIRAYPWPGNVRELENAIERAAILCDDAVIEAELLGLNPRAGRAAKAQPVSASSAVESLDEYFVRFVREHQDGTSETDLARALGISRKTLWERRARFNLPRAK
jgi:DNA-binding NtrC family response regulator